VEKNEKDLCFGLEEIREENYAALVNGRILLQKKKNGEGGKEGNSLKTGKP